MRIYNGESREEWGHIVDDEPQSRQGLATMDDEPSCRCRKCFGPCSPCDLFCAGCEAEHKALTAAKARIEADLARAFRAVEVKL